MQQSYKELRYPYLMDIAKLVQACSIFEKLERCSDFLGGTARLCCENGL